MNIILCHGFLGFSKIGPVEYFRGVVKHFKDDLKHNVITPKVDPTQSIAVRGSQLRQQIEQAFDHGTLVARHPTHIIAHSMGGLDSRFILSPANEEHIQLAIRSLTTISTPHRGSLIADYLDRPEHTKAGASIKAFETALKVAGISLDGLRNLTTDRCLEFDSKFTDHEGVAYFYVAGTGADHVSALLRPLRELIHSVTGEVNDGLVAVSSARRGGLDFTSWPVDHTGEVGYDVSNLLAPAPDGHLERYDRIVERVAGL
jgi:triacylglycerol lipase